MLTDDSTQHAGYVAGFSAPWNGIALYRSPIDSGFVLNTVLSGPAILGFTRFDFFSGPLGRWDYGNELYVELLGGTLASVERLILQAGANGCAIENADGDWELLQFRNATLEAASQYRLDTLLRGQRGSEAAMRDPVAAGARVVFFNLAIREVAMDAADVGLEYYFRHGPANLPIGDDLYATEAFTFAGRGLAPYSPAHLRGHVEANDDITLSWRRRTRIGGDSWSYYDDVPLSETSEAYEVDILDAMDDVLRTLAVSAENATYEAADQVTDFGALADDFDIVVYQISDSAGRGSGRRETIWLEGQR
jgi:hypothetical protein